MVIFVDFSKAFDSCNHALLLKKLESNGIRGQCLNFFKSYFDKRAQSVKCGFAKDESPCPIKFNKESGHREIHCGVFAGTTCGPLLFNLYVNSLFKCKIYSFSDNYDNHLLKNTLSFFTAQSSNKY